MKRVFLSSLIILFSALFILASPPSGTDQALLEQGIQLKNKGNLVAAFDTLSTIRILHPDSALLPVAEYEMGLTFLYDNRPVEAALQFQQVISRYPSSEQARLSLNMNATLYRLYIAPVTNRRVFVPDSAYSAILAEMDNPVGMAMDSEGKLYLSDRGKKSFYTFDPSGKMINSSTILSPYSISVTPKNDVLIGNDSTLYTTTESVSFPRINPQTQASMGYLEEIRSAAVNNKGEYFVISGKVSGVSVFDPARKPLSRPAIGRAEDYEKVLINALNNIHLLSRKGDFVQVYDPEGKLLFALNKTGKEMTFGKFEDFALDSANHIYILTNNPKGVLIYSPAGKFLRFLGSEKTSPIFFDDSKLIAIGPAGSIYVLDKGVRRIIKLG
ncbi:hypothetical protein L0156_04730 [bacterium]|nr:hypothetical protein [bacterium]